VARILVIDDDDAVRAAIKAILDFEGHEAVLACDGRQGLLKPSGGWPSLARGAEAGIHAPAERSAIAVMLADRRFSIARTAARAASPLVSNASSDWKRSFPSAWANHRKRSGRSVSGATLIENASSSSIAGKRPIYATSSIRRRSPLRRPRASRRGGRLEVQPALSPAFRKRTPGPSPFFAMNSTPADSSVPAMTEASKNDG
jgi:hypothetical protein